MIHGSTKELNLSSFKFNCYTFVHMMDSFYKCHSSKGTGVINNNNDGCSPCLCAGFKGCGIMNAGTLALLKGIK